ncbi:Virion core and cleavage processing protein [Sea otter poxvirus]|uniref:25 kDa core protein OPG138 n=1 Tax=Sea otter poxvirus TaxID=1416741 RepID=A0A2U9QHT2_9POXV|nr:Virion core and cleavage processing protein [Sea otter poxvirus]AWU47146.1 Virion core and cleavage processing protein [Sea otter poxvirus]
MADKTARSSYEDYIVTLKKLAPQLTSLLAHIGGDQSGIQSVQQLSVTDSTDTVNNADTIVGGSNTYDASISKRNASRTKGRNTKMGAPRRQRRAIDSDNTMMQAVTNGGKIVFGTVKDGKLEVKGTVGELDHDLLGIDTVNAGRRNKNTSIKHKRRQTIAMHNQDNVDDCTDAGMC